MKPAILFAPTLRLALAKAGHPVGPCTRAGRTGWAFTTGEGTTRLKITVEPAP